MWFDKSSNCLVNGGEQRLGESLVENRLCSADRIGGVVLPSECGQHVGDQTPSMAGGPGSNLEVLVGAHRGSRTLSQRSVSVGVALRRHIECLLALDELISARGAAALGRYLIQSNRVDFLFGGVDCLGEFGPAFYELISLGPGRGCIEGLGPQYRDWFVRRSSQCAFESAAALIGCPQFVVECGAVGADLTQFGFHLFIQPGSLSSLVGDSAGAQRHGLCGGDLGCELGRTERRYVGVGSPKCFDVRLDGLHLGLHCIAALPGSCYLRIGDDLAVFCDGSWLRVFARTTNWAWLIVDQCVRDAGCGASNKCVPQLVGFGPGLGQSRASRRERERCCLIVDNSVVAALAFFVRSECQVGFFLRGCVCRLRVDCGVACLLKPVDGRVEFRGLTHELAVNDLNFGQFGALCQPGFGCAKRGFAFVDIGSLFQVGQFGCGLTKPRGRGLMVFVEIACLVVESTKITLRLSDGCGEILDA